MLLKNMKQNGVHKMAETKWRTQSCPEIEKITK